MTVETLLTTGNPKAVAPYAARRPTGLTYEQLGAWVFTNTRPRGGTACLIWQGGVSKVGVPQVWWENRCIQVRRLAYAAAHGLNEVQMRRYIKAVHSTCGEALCLNPAHWRSVERTMDWTPSYPPEAWGRREAV